MKFDPSGFKKFLESREGQEAFDKIMAKKEAKAKEYKEKREAYLKKLSEDYST